MNATVHLNVFFLLLRLYCILVDHKKMLTPSFLIAAGYFYCMAKLYFNTINYNFLNKSMSYQEL